MKSKTFRLEDSDIALLKQIANTKGVSQSDAIRYAIQNAANALHDETPKEQPDEVVSELVRQLQVKDGQIEALSQALINAQETAKAAQVLHAKSTVAELPEVVEEQPKEPWWKRIFS